MIFHFFRQNGHKSYGTGVVRVSAPGSARHLLYIVDHKIKTIIHLSNHIWCYKVSEGQGFCVLGTAKIAKIGIFDVNFLLGLD